MTTVRAWTDRNFRRLWVGSSASWFGAEIGELAIPLLALITLAATPAELGLLRTMQFLPFLLATLPLGVLVDRCRKRPLMIGADLGRFVLIGGIPVLIWVGAGHLELVYVFVFAAAMLTVLYQLSDFAFLPRVVTSERLLDANSKLTATQSAAEIGGKGLGGLLVQALTAPFAVLFNAVGYLVSAFAISRIDIDERIERKAGRSVWREVAEGLRIVLRNKYLRPLVSESTTYNLFFELFLVGLMVFAVRDLGMSAALIGLAFTIGAVGTFLGAWFGARVAGRFGYGRVLLVTFLVGNSASVLLLLMNDKGTAILILASVFFLMGLGTGIANVHATSLRQTVIPSALHGRVNAAYRMVSWGAVPIGASLGGLIATQFSPHTAMLVGALGIPLGTVWIAFSAIPKVRSIAEVQLGAESPPER
ncbi:MFS transporter [Tenggerimyces flavus]|uniref:MFS transporter n=1 Tax=Tenggerimyces flavus TaxID=1708749 RepID=A0ABV7YL29_9ACTN|nr:MFS transporter [Tenggerimyces flavus]MBM7784939.1 MFS family permease [Tenggerimyces flavus]